MNEIKINEHGETEVQIAKIGKVFGSDRNGNAVEQNFTDEAFAKIAEDLNSGNKEILIDQDHKSLKPGVERDTTAAGWASGFKVVPGKGLFGTIKWTDIGRKLIENRCFRWLSPVFKLNENKEPVELVNAAMTNMPAQKGIEPIINSAPVEISEQNLTKETLIMEITRDALVQLIKDVLAEQAKPVEEVKAEEKTEEVKNEETPSEKPVEEKTEEVKEEVKEEIKVAEEVPAEKPVEEKPVEEKAENACPAKNEEVPTEKVVEEKKEEDKEVIKIEALNSAPSSLGVGVKEDEPWKQLTGKEFWDWLAKHPQGV